jgi:ATP-dependent RNA helicase SUPV3L1/SUV3
MAPGGCGETGVAADEPFPWVREPTQVIAFSGRRADLYFMTSHARAPVVAVLGPTNTGKTHLAIERMCAHSSGMIGFPLRLLAREVYDRVVKLKGERQVALITGEEKILPKEARWFLCTAESMPMERDFAFVALDEAQLGADPERGHVFTDRLLHARGREETMILGSEALRPLVRALVPDAEIITRPRFSTLTYAGPCKLSRLPPRSAIVAFSAEQVYAVAEMLRRMRGGAAVVMGALSPRTRNAQVAMYQAGEVDYLVATDAVGMGLNMDVTHVAFAGLSKFDGKKRRRLFPAEMAQIAGRAGRHQKDGTFGTLLLEGEMSPEFRPEEIEAIEEHRFQELGHLYWREGDPDFRTIDALIRSLEERPDRIELRPAPEAIDLAVLKRLAADGEVRARATSPERVRRLWAACGLPDFRKTGPEHHARLVSRIYMHLTEGSGRIPGPWYAAQVASLDNMQGDIDTLADRIAGVRTWAYIAHRADWLAEPEAMAERARGVEEKLSDALHERLTQRFVDRRTAVLMRDLGAKGVGEFPVLVDEQGEVSVGSYPIGRMTGFTFEVDPAARHGDRKMLLAAAERRLGGEYEKRAAALVADTDAHFTLRTTPGEPVAVLWRGHEVARLAAGKNLLSPFILLDRRLERLSQRGKDAVVERLKNWVAAAIEKHLGALRRAGLAARDPGAPAPVRAILAMLVDEGGIIAREIVQAPLGELDREQRRSLGRLRVQIGALDLFIADLLKPEAKRWRTALRMAAEGKEMPALPRDAAVLLPTPDEAERRLLERLGFRALGPQMLRVDMVERLARHAHEARTGKHATVVDEALATSLGLQPQAVARLMRDLGFRPAANEAGWLWRGRKQERPAPPPPRSSNAFAALAGLRRG